MEVVLFLNFGSYINLPTLFAFFLGFDVPTSSSIFFENVFFCLLEMITCSLTNNFATTQAHDPDHML